MELEKRSSFVFPTRDRKYSKILEVDDPFKSGLRKFKTGHFYILLIRKVRRFIFIHNSLVTIS